MCVAWVKLVLWDFKEGRKVLCKYATYHKIQICCQRCATLSLEATYKEFLVMV